MWVFGYGSLLWYTDFPFDKAVPGCVRGYSRRFWQLSPDHRGTPQKMYESQRTECAQYRLRSTFWNKCSLEQEPGRTVTLVADQKGSTWGLAYKVKGTQEESTIEYLDVREKAGYVRQQVDFYPDDGSDPFPLNVYLAAEDSNPYFTGPVDNDTVVETIVTSKGPSGTNIEYALRLADCVRRMAPHIRDEHLFSIESKVKQRCRVLRVHDPVLSDLGILPPIQSADDNNEV